MSGPGHGTHALGMELTVIAAVVIGGTALTGGDGYVLGALFGVLITALIQSLIQFNGQLSSWWTSIFIGLLMLLFIGVQSLLSTRNSRRLASAALGDTQARRTPRWRDRRVLIGAGVVIAIFIAAQALGWIGGGSTDAGRRQAGGGSGMRVATIPPGPGQSASPRHGASIVYERNGGAACIDELFAVYPDGRITGDDGTQKVEATTTPEAVTALVASLESLGWFTDDMFSTSHKPCGQCFTYFTTVTSGAGPKTVQAVDGGTDAPAKYWLATSRISAILPKFGTAP